MQADEIRAVMEDPVARRLLASANPARLAYVEGARKVTPAEEFPRWEAGVQALYDQMVRIDVTPTWARVHDFETRIPQAVEELARSRFDRS